MSTRCPPSLYVAWASFYMLKGLPTGSDAGEGKNGNGLCVQCRTVLSYLLLMAGDKGIKCPSGSPEQCRGGPLGAPPFATTAILSAVHATARLRLRGAPPRAFGRAPE